MQQKTGRVSGVRPGLKQPCQGVAGEPITGTKTCRWTLPTEAGCFPRPVRSRIWKAACGIHLTLNKFPNHAGTGFSHWNQHLISVDPNHYRIRWKRSFLPSRDAAHRRGGSVCNYPIPPDPNTNLQHTGQLVLISFRELSPSRLPEQHHRPNRFYLLGIFPLVWVQLI